MNSVQIGQATLVNLTGYAQRINGILVPVDRPTRKLSSIQLKKLEEDHQGLKVLKPKILPQDNPNIEKLIALIKASPDKTFLVDKYQATAFSERHEKFQNCLIPVINKNAPTGDAILERPFGM